MSNKNNLNTNTKHPKGLWWLSLVYATYAISYGVLFANLLLYIIHSKNINMHDSTAYSFFAAFASLTFILPLFGGYLCDKFGFKRVAKIGVAVLVLGFLVLSIDNLFYLYLGVALCLAGNALAMPAIWSMTGLIYTKDSPLRDSGAILFYILFNIGFLISFSTSGLLAQFFGYRIMFIVFSLGACLSFAVLYIKGNSIEIGKQTISKKSPINLLGWVIGLIAISLALLKIVILNNLLMWSLVAGIIIYLFILSNKKENLEYKSKIRLFIFLCFLAIIGVTIYNSEFGLLPEFAYHSINMSVFGYKFSASAITTLDPLFCIILGYILNSVWKKVKDKNSFGVLIGKISLGIILPAIGYLLISLFLFLNLSGKISSFMFLPVFALFVLGELLVIPTGIAMSGKLAPKGKEGMFMGVWNVMQGFSALITGYIAYFTTLKVVHHNQYDINSQYLKVFLISGIIIFILGFVGWFSRKYIKSKAI